MSISVECFVEVAERNDVEQSELAAEHQIIKVASDLESPDHVVLFIAGVRWCVQGHDLILAVHNAMSTH